MFKIRSERRPWIRAVLAAVVGILVSRGARAEPTSAQTAADARALYDEGARHFDVGEYDQAIDHFQRAYVITGAPMLLLNLGQAQRLKGACALSASAYRSYLEKAPVTEHRTEVERRIREMDACAAPKDAPERHAEEPEEPGTREADAGHPGAPLPTSVRADAPRASSSAPTWAWIGVGLGAAGATLGAIGLGLTLDAQADLDRVCASSGACPRSAGKELDAYERWRVVAVSGAAATVVGAAMAVVGFMAANRKGSSPDLAHARSRGVVVSPWLGLSEAGLRGTF